MTNFNLKIDKDIKNLKARNKKIQYCSSLSSTKYLPEAKNLKCTCFCFALICVFMMMLIMRG